MVGVPGEECRSAIQLFEEQHLRERVWQGHGRKPKRHLRLALRCKPADRFMLVSDAMPNVGADIGALASVASLTLGSSAAAR